MKLLILHYDAYYIKKELEKHFPEIEIYAATKEDQIGAEIENTDILMATRISDGLLGKAKKLSWIQSTITGVDFFLELPSFPENILLTSAKGIHGPQMVEMIFMHMLLLSRNYPRMLENQKKGKWERWAQPLLKNKSVGILGVGAIGKELARKCNVFDMTVYGIVSKKREIEYVHHCYDITGLIDVLEKVDYFINIIPFTPATKNIIGDREFSAMKPKAFFINVGRGQTVDEDALIRALKKKDIAGAALDVFCAEPLPKNNPLWYMDNVIITPHVGGMSDTYSDQVLPILKENLRCFINGDRQNLINVVDF